MLVANSSMNLCISSGMQSMSVMHALYMDHAIFAPVKLVACKLRRSQALHFTFAHLSPKLCVVFTFDDQTDQWLQATGEIYIRQHTQHGEVMFVPVQGNSFANMHV